MKNEQEEMIQARGGEQKLTVGTAQFRAALTSYPAADQEALEWLWGYLYQVHQGRVQSLLEELCVAYIDLHRVFSGRATEQYSAVISAAADLRRRVARQLPLVETDVTRDIMETLDYARDYGAMVAIVGSTGRGKTYTAKHWAALNNHGRTRYIRAGSNSSRSALLRQLCVAAGSGWSGYKNFELEQRIMTNSAYTSRNVLIVDEAGHLIPKGGNNTGAIELIRDLHDNTGCAVALIFTDVYLEQMTLGRLNRFFEQFRGRIEKVCRISESPDRGEVEAAVRNFCPGAGEEVIASACAVAGGNGGKLRTLFRDLQKALLLANDDGRKVITVDDLATAIEWRSAGAL